jgi:RNA polymerase sigma factor (sigma-70 family)
MPERDFGELVPQAVFGDQGAWSALVKGLGSVALSVARTYRLSDADARDVSQSTWLAVSQQLGSLRDSARLPGWLATTARRQALRILSGRSSEVALSCDRDVVPSPESLVLRQERDSELWTAVARLPTRQRRLLWILAHRPELTYAEIAAELGISPGSVGPFRKRCLDKLRHRLLADGFEPDL